MKNVNSLSAPINSSGEQVCVLDGCLVRVKCKDCPDKVSVMANVRGILLNSYRRDSIKRVYCLYRVSTLGQVEKDDIPMQKQRCREFAAAQG